MSPDARRRTFEALLVIVATLSLVWRVSALPVGGSGLGVDWYNYLQNAWAMGNGHWQDYVRWRGPAHAWLALAAAARFGGLIVGAQWVAGVCMVALVPLTWALGRATFGRTEALAATVLIAAWPDFALFGRFSTPYPLFAMAMTLAMVGLAAGLGARTRWGGLGGATVAALALGLAIATDQRAIPLTATLGVAALGAPLLRGEGNRSAVSWSRAIGMAAILVGGGLSLGYLANGQLPFELVPLSEQVALQRDLHASEGQLQCIVPGKQLPGLVDFVGACARQTIARNLVRAEACVGVGLPLLALLTAAGAIVSVRGSHNRWRVWFLLPTVTLLPSLLLVDVPHRYVLPFAPLFALFIVHGIHALFARVRLAAAQGGLLVTVAVILIAQYTNEGSPMGRARTGKVPHGIAPPVVLGQARPMDTMGEQLRRDVHPGDQVIDCARGGLHLRLYPFPVEQERPPRPTVVAGRCRELLAGGPDHEGTTWLLTGIPTDASVNPTWQQAFLIPRPMERIALLRADK